MLELVSQAMKIRGRGHAARLPFPEGDASAYPRFAATNRQRSDFGGSLHLAPRTP